VTDRVVSVRIPTTLVLELKERIQHEHFKDLSELVRTIVRKRFLGSQSVKEFGDLDREQLVQELQRLLERLRK